MDGNPIPPKSRTSHCISTANISSFSLARMTIRLDAGDFRVDVA